MSAKLQQSEVPTIGLDPLAVYIVTTVAASLVGIGYRALMDAIERGALPAVKVGRDYVVKLSDAEAYRDKPYGPRKPKPVKLARRYNGRY